MALTFASAALAQGSGASPSTASSGQWKLDPANVDAILDIRLAASAPVKGESDKVYPSLVVACRQGKLRVRLEAQMTLDVASDRTPLDLRWDGGKAEYQNWRVTPSVDEVIVPDAAPFISRLARTKTLRAEIVPDHRKPVTVNFAPAGLSSFGQLLATACAGQGLDSTLSVVPRVARLEPAASAVINGETWYMLSQVESPVRDVPGTLNLVYPRPLIMSGIKGEVTAEFVVDTTGRADMTTYKVISSNHELYTKAVRAAVAAARYYPAEIDERKVRQLVHSAFTFMPPK